MTFFNMCDVQDEDGMDEAIEVLLDVYHAADTNRYSGPVSFTGRHANDEFCDMLGEYLGVLRSPNLYDSEWRLDALHGMLDKTQRHYPSVIWKFFE